MNYKVLYRKYRPENFDNLVGQENIIKILNNSIINKKLSHAYIFSGPRGTGKTSSAKIFAKNINCLEPIEGKACNKCINCINSSNSSDIIEIDAASNNGVDEIRELINNVKLVPNSLNYKVYIIDEVHMLSPNAFNALLLTLEEPPSHVIFILATTNVESVPITILSRCQRFDFKKISVDDIFKRLKYIANLEKISITDNAILQIANISDGGLRDSLSLLDQISKENENIDEEIVSKYSGNVSSIAIKHLLQLINDNKIGEVDSLLKEFSKQRVDYKLLVKGIISQIACEVKEIVINNKKTRISVDNYKKMILELTDFQNKINVNVDVYSLLTVILFSYLEFKETIVTTENNIEKQIKIEEKQIKEKEKLFTSKIDNKLKQVRINNCFAEASKDEKHKIIPIWNDFKNDACKEIRNFLLDTNIAMCSNNIITIYLERENDLEELENLLDILIQNFTDYSKISRKIVLVTKKEWEDLIEKFKKDKNSGIIYRVEDESKYVNIDSVNVNDIFDNVEEI